MKTSEKKLEYNREYTAKTNAAAQKKYQEKVKGNFSSILLKLDKVADADIISYLDSAGNKTAYLKSVIRKDMKGGL